MGTFLRQLRWRMFAFLAVLLMVLTSVFSVFYQRFLASKMAEAAASHSEVLADTIHLGLVQNMIAKNREGIQLSLQDIVQNILINEVLIADPEGRIVFASRPGRIGRNLKNSDFSGIGGRKPWKVMEREGGGGSEIFRVSTINNHRACQECHSPARTSLGSIVLRMSLTNSDTTVKESWYYFAALAAGLLLMLLFGSSVFVSRNVTRPLNGLRQRFREVRKGVEGSSTFLPAAGADEIGQLRLGFEEILVELEKSHQREKEKEKDAVLVQQDRAHQRELQELHLLVDDSEREIRESDEKILKITQELEHTHERLQSAFKNISSLNRVGMALSSEIDLEKLVNLLVNISVKGLRAEIGHIMLLQEDTGKLEMKAWAGMSEGFDPTRTVNPGESVSGAVAKTGKAMLIAKVDGSNSIKILSRYGYRRTSVISAPIKIKNKILGVIELTNRRGPSPFDEDDLTMLHSIANQAAVAIENANLLREVRQSYFDTIKALIQAVEEKDRYTRGHSERVTTFSVKIAKKMGFSDKEIERIRYAGVLHDIGKIGIDVNILQKPDLLTEEEYTVVRNHPRIGERIINPIAFLQDVMPIVGQHHERYDGKGYPNGIHGSKMAVEARILAVADAYDAMITSRPYRSALPREAATAELRRCSGTQFDPIVVEHFLEILHEDPDIRKLEDSLSAVGT